MSIPTAHHDAQRSIYHAHPLLDPLLLRNDSSQARPWLSLYRQLKREGHVREGLFPFLTGPAVAVKGITDITPTVTACLRDVDTYLDDLLAQVSAERAGRLRTLPATRAMNDPLDLFRACFEGRDPRHRYEAQRKLYLGKLLFSIDHCRPVRDGHRHRTLLIEHLESTLFAQSREGTEFEVCCRFAADEGARGTLERVDTPAHDAQCWRFRVRILPAFGEGPPIEVFHQRYRFKREAMPTTPERTDEGFLRLGEGERWPGLGRRSGSILNKMICRGITDPHQVQDVLGAMFIVADREQAYALEHRLLRVLGGPAWARDRTDTLTDERDRHLLSSRSAVGFQVLKETVDLLVSDPVDLLPYHFAVELQIYPLESYLSTIHDAHYASHSAYKRRQLLGDVLPALFPSGVFGDA